MKNKDKKKKLQRIQEVAEGKLSIDDLSLSELQLMHQIMIDTIISRDADPLLPGNDTIH